MASFHSFYGSAVLHYVYAPHLLYLFGSGHLGCFHILGIVTSSALSFQLTAFSQYMSRSGIAGSWGSLIFWRAFIVFFILATPIYIPTNSVQVFLFSTSLPTFICALLDDGYFGRYEGVISVGVDLHFIDYYRYKTSFPVLVCHLYVFFGKKCLLRPLGLFK